MFEPLTPPLVQYEHARNASQLDIQNLEWWNGYLYLNHSKSNLLVQGGPQF